jgi:hypothetical protein
MVPGTFQAMYQQWKTLQTFLAYPIDVTLGEIFHHLYPHVAAYYRAIRQQYPDPLAAMWMIYKGRDHESANSRTNSQNLPQF